MAEGLKEVRASIQKNIDTRQGGAAEKKLKRLAGCIDRGIEAVANTLAKIPCYVEDLRAMYHMFDPKTGGSADRRTKFATLRAKLRASGDPIQRKMADVMKSFEPGLFAGGNKLAWLQDNLDLERWFRTPKAHRRKIHGRQHAGVSIVQEGPSLVLALDAHLNHRRPFTEEELQPYLGAMPTPEELDAIERRKTMRRGSSRKARPGLLADLETRYAPPPPAKKRVRSRNHETGG